MAENLDELRRRIDVVDSKILEAIQNRFELTKQIGLYKLKSKDSVLQENRWAEVITKLESEAISRKIPVEMVKNIWNEIHIASQNQQANIKNNDQ